MAVDLFEQAGISQEGPRDLFELNGVLDKQLKDQARIVEGGNKQLETLKGVGEAGLSMVSQIPASIAGGLYGLSKVVTGQGIDAANKAMEDTIKWNFGAGAYIPKSEKGQKYSENFGEAMLWPGQKAGELAESITGSPEAYLAARLPIDTALSLLPLKIPSAISSALPKGSGSKPQRVEPKMSKEDIIKSGKVEEPGQAQQPIPTEAQQELLPSNAPQYGIDQSNNAGHWSLDENGMPISAERSMDVQMAQTPLQRDLFSEEYLPAQGAERTLPEAIDKMVVEAPDLPRENMDNHSYEISRALFNQEVPDNLVATRQQIQRQFEGDDPVAQAMLAAAADMDTPTNVMRGTGDPSLNQGMGSLQRGAIDPEVFKEGFRGLNRWLSKLTDQPWVKQRFPANMYETNQDGTPLILLHGTRTAFDDQPRGVGMEGLHAGYATAATLKASERRGGAIPYRIGNVNFTGGMTDSSAVYPIVIRKGNYPTLSKDYGSFAPYILANDKNFALDVSRATNGRYGFYEVQEALQDWARTSPGSDAADNTRFAKMLKDQFGIDGFWYSNKYETTKTKLFAQAGEHQTPSRARKLGAALDYTKSFVTWNDNNVRSLYDEPIQRPLNRQSGVLNIGDIADWLTGKTVRGASQSSSLPTWKDLEVDPNFKLEDTKETPRSATNIALKQKAKRVADITGIEKGVYGDIYTAEEARSNPGPDVTNNPVRDQVTPGLEGMVRTNAVTNILKFARTMFTGARNQAEKFSKTFVTGANGVNRLYRDLNKQEWMDVAEALQIASREKTALTPEMMQQLGFNEKQVAFVNRLRESLDTMFDMANDALTKQGFKPLKYHGGYVPNMFTGAYTSLVGKYVATKDGKKRFVVKGVAQGDTKAQHKAALEYYSKQGEDFAVVVDLPFKGLRDGANRANRVFDGFNDMINIIAESDKDFAAVKALADEYAAGKLKNMYDFKVHEKKKTGARGSLGNRPWLKPEENAKEFLEGLINYLEDGARYYSYQTALNEVGRLTRDEKLSVTHPNTLKYLEKYITNITGQGTSPMGQGLNYVINLAAKSLGQSPQAWGRNMNRVMSAMSAMMMGTINLPFFITQLSQPIIAGIPEGIRLQGEIGTSFVTSVKNNTMYLPALMLEKMTGDKYKSNLIPQHYRNAIQYAEDSGMMNFSEAELAHEVLQSKTERTLNAVGHWPSVLSERLTRPPMFLAFADMFVRAGFPEEVAFRKAQYATDYTMANYHPDERPMFYNQFGLLGRFMGALTTYKHNLGHGMYYRAQEALTNKAIAPAVAATAAMYLFYGVSGIMGYEEADQIYRMLTGESIKHAVLNDDLVHSDVWHGLISTRTGIDFQSRLSMASALPDSPLAFLSPQGSMLADMVGAAYNAAKNRDEASFNELALNITPVGMRGLTEQLLFTDEQGFLLNKENERKFSQPRSEEEQKLRAGVGFRPLRERLESDDVYRRSREERKRTDKLSNASKRFSTAVSLGDNQGASRHLEEYVENGGDIRTLLNSTKLKNWYINSYKSERERQQGTPGNNLNQINKYQGYQQ